MANTVFNLSSLDPDTLTNSFIDYLKTKPLFQDFNYNGPNIKILLELLSRNSYLLSFYQNMAFNEAFLDSAQLRDNLISKSKMFNYVPSSVTSSVGSVNVAFICSTGNSFTIPLGSNFIGYNSNGTYNFVTTKDYVQVSGNSYFYFPGVELSEGKYTTETFIIDNTIENQIFKLSNPTIDISSLQISVSEDGVTNTAYRIINNVYNINGNNKVAYLQATANNLYEFYFGDGILGYKPPSGSIVYSKYINSFGSDADECGTFYLLDNLSAYNNTNISNVTLTTVSNSVGGSQAESIESIRFNTPKAFQTQNSPVTSNDFKFLILNNFNAVGDVNVFGGNVTPNSVNFGSIYISAVSKAGNPLTNNLKDNIKGFLAPRSVLQLSNLINFIDANTLWINVSTSMHIDFTQTNNSPNYYRAVTTNTIINYSSTSLEKFNKPFKYSNLTSVLDQVDSNNIILSNETSFTLQKDVNIDIGKSNNIYVSFGNPILDVKSSNFVVNGYTSFITDNFDTISIQKGTLSLISYIGNSSIISTTVGTINYDEGLISIPALTIDDYINDGGLFFISTPKNKFINANSNDIIKINVDAINVEITSG